MAKRVKNFGSVYFNQNIGRWVAQGFIPGSDRFFVHSSENRGECDFALAVIKAEWLRWRIICEWRMDEFVDVMEKLDVVRSYCEEVGKWQSVVGRRKENGRWQYVE